MIDSLTPYRVHTSGRIAFKGCRRRWYFAANEEGALGLEPITWQPPLWMGTGIHFALQHYYKDPTRKVDPAKIFREWVWDWENDHPATLALMDDEKRFDYKSMISLACAMLTNYRGYAPQVDNFRVVDTEINFQTPIIDPFGNPMMRMIGGVLRPCVYEGRLDGLVQDGDGLYWILEHKSLEGIDDRKLQTDEQSGSYIWACQRIYGVRIAGVIYNVLLKRTPLSPPLVYVGTKNERLSIAQATITTTTLEAYRAAIKEVGHDESRYADVLQQLEAQGWNPFFRRYEVRRNPREIDEIGQRIYYETMDMTREDLFLYPNADQVRCPWCPFRTPCIAMSEGSDWEQILTDNYRKRESTDVEYIEAMPA